MARHPVSWRKQTRAPGNTLPYLLVTMSVSSAFSFVMNHGPTVLLKEADPDEILSPLVNPWNWQLLLSVLLYYFLPTENHCWEYPLGCPRSPDLKTFFLDPPAHPRCHIFLQQGFSPSEFTCDSLRLPHNCPVPPVWRVLGL